MVFLGDKMRYLKAEGSNVIKSGLHRATAEREVRALYPNTSLPSCLPEEMLEQHDYFPEHPTPQPEGDVVTPGEPELRADGKWYQTWNVRPYTQEEIDAMTPQPEWPQFTALEMLDLFTESEQLAVVQATMSNASVKLWYDRLIAATFVTYEDPRTEGGLQALVDAGLLDPGRKAEIVAAMQPQTEPT